MSCVLCALPRLFPRVGVVLFATQVGVHARVPGNALDRDLATVALPAARLLGAVLAVGLVARVRVLLVRVRRVRVRRGWVGGACALHCIARTGPLQLRSSIAEPVDDGEALVGRPSLVDLVSPA